MILLLGIWVCISVKHVHTLVYVMSLNKLLDQMSYTDQRRYDTHTMFCTEKLFHEVIDNDMCAFLMLNSTPFNPYGFVSIYTVN